MRAVAPASASARGLVSVATTRSAVRGEMQGLDAAAGAEVERRVDRLADDGPGEGDRRRAEPEDVVGPDGPRPRRRSRDRRSAAGRCRRVRRAAGRPALRPTVIRRRGSSTPVRRRPAGRPTAGERVAGRRPSARLAPSRKSRMSVLSGDPSAVARSARGPLAAAQRGVRVPARAASSTASARKSAARRSSPSRSTTRRSDRGRVPATRRHRRAESGRDAARRRGARSPVLGARGRRGPAARPCAPVARPGSRARPRPGRGPARAPCRPARRPPGPPA